MISKSYPYLSIAKKYGLEYGDVLKIAHAATYGGWVPIISGAPASFYYDVEIAAGHFRNVRSGIEPFH